MRTDTQRPCLGRRRYLQTQVQEKPSLDLLMSDLQFPELWDIYSGCVSQIQKQRCLHLLKWNNDPKWVCMVHPSQALHCLAALALLFWLHYSLFSYSRVKVLSSVFWMDSLKACEHLDSWKSWLSAFWLGRVYTNAQSMARIFIVSKIRHFDSNGKSN